MQNKVATIGLVAFLAIDVALVALALRPGRPGRPSRRPARPPRSSRRRRASVDQDPRDDGHLDRHGHCGARTAAGTRDAAHRGARRDDRLARRRPAAVRRAARPCSVTADGGKTWDKTKAPARSVTRVQPLDEDRVFAVGAGADCELKQYASNDRGDSWQAPSAVSGGWARQLDKPTEVLTPQDDRAQPCGPSTDVVDLSRTSASQAQALCVDGSVKVTSDGGETWTDAGTVKGGLALGNRLEAGQLTTYVARVARRLPGHRPRAGRQGQEPPRASPASARACRRRPARSACRSSPRPAGWSRATQVWTAPAALTSWKQP